MTKSHVFPTFEEQPEGLVETPIQRGARVLSFLIATNGWTATLSTVDLERAEQSAVLVTAPRDAHPLVLAKVTAVKHIIALVLKARRMETKGVAEGFPEISQAMDPSDPARLVRPLGPMGPAPALRVAVPVIDF